MNKKYVITAAQKGAVVNTKFFNTLKNYCKRNKAQLMVIPLEHSMGNLKQYQDAEIDEVANDYLVITDTKLCRKLEVSTLPIFPTAMKPLTSLHRLGNHSRIYGSTKLALDVVPTSNHKLPKIIASTGVITDPLYNMKNKRGRIASIDHKYSAIVVEVVNDNEFHIRQLEANGNFEVNDLGKRYSGNRVRKAKAEFFVWGDYHLRETDQIVKRVTLNEIIPLVKPKKMVFHDFSSCESINPHHDRDIVTRSLKSEKKRNNLMSELLDIQKELDELKKQTKADMYIVYSNHHDFLARYLKEGKFINDPDNLLISTKLLLKMLESGDANSCPIKLWYESNNPNDSRVTFLGVDDDFKYKGIQLANHGHLGANGSRGSVKSEELGSIKAVVGHTHSPAIFRDIWRVGTSTLLKLDYNKGFSSWVNTHCIGYEDGTRQLINIINGKWRG